MLQGENVPSCILTLRECLEGEDSIVALKFCLFALVGVMSGLLGAQNLRGSLFMSEKNASNVVLGIQHLQQIGNASPTAIYWSYITARGTQLGLMTGSVQQLALARLACLTRTTTTNLKLLLRTWESLSHTEREVLTGHLLADGICNICVLFAFLPQYFANAIANPSVGLRRSLILLMELFEMVHARGRTD